LGTIYIGFGISENSTNITSFVNDKPRTSEDILKNFLTNGDILKLIYEPEQL